MRSFCLVLHRTARRKTVSRTWEQKIASEARGRKYDLFQLQHEIISDVAASQTVKRDVINCNVTVDFPLSLEIPFSHVFFAKRRQFRPSRCLYDKLMNIISPAIIIFAKLQAFPRVYRWSFPLSWNCIQWKLKTIMIGHEFFIFLKHPLRVLQIFSRQNFSWA